MVAFTILGAINTAAQTVFGAYAITKTNQLVSFNRNNPMMLIAPPTAITGLAVGQDIVGFDARPRTGEFYVLGYDAANGTARLYKLNVFTSALTAVGAADFAITLGNATNNVGFDFNPTVDRIRVLSTNGKNFRLHPDLGTLVAGDTDLTYGMGDVNANAMPKIGQIAYTNSYVAATKTTLYYLDEANGVFGTALVATLPNNGQIKTIGTIGLALNAMDKSIDMDVQGTSSDNIIYLAANTPGGGDALYTINPATGGATLLGYFGNGTLDIKDIAMPIANALTNNAVTDRICFALTTHAAPRLISFDVAAPSFILRDVPVTGIKVGQTLAAMDMRPQDNKLYALGFVADTSTLYTINDTTGVATIFADSLRMQFGGSPHIGFDFNPAANRLRIVSAATRNNYRLNLTVAPVTITQDTALTYKSTDVNASRTPFVGSVAYTNSFAGATATAMYDIDEKAGLFVRQNTPNGGFLNTIGSLGVAFDTLDYSVDIDVATSGTNTSPVNKFYLCANRQGSNNFDNIYQIDLATGAANSNLGSIGGGIGVRDIALKIGGVVIVSNNEVALNDLHARFAPNPTTGILNISFDNIAASRQVEISVFDLSGRLVQQLKLDNSDRSFRQDLDLSQYNSGIYTIRLVTEQGISVQKIVKL